MDNTGDDDSVTWSITTNGADADGDGTAPFAINAGTGVITLADSGDLDYEDDGQLQPSCAGFDGATQDDSETITITITDVGLTVTDTSANLGETAATGATVVDVDNTGDDDIAGQVSGPSRPTVLTPTDGTSPFAINAGTGVITLADSDDIDFETTVTYNLVVQERDGVSQSDSETITITVTDVVPTVMDTSANMAETDATGATVVECRQHGRRRQRRMVDHDQRGRC